MNGEIILLSRHINGIILPSRHMRDTFFVLKGEVGPFLLVDAKLAKRGYVRDTKIAIVKN